MLKFRTVSSRLFVLSCLPTLGALFVVVLVLLYSEGWLVRESNLVSEAKFLEKAFQRQRVGFSHLSEGLVRDYGLFLGQKSTNFDNYSKAKLDFNSQLLQFKEDDTSKNYELIAKEAKDYQRSIDEYLLIHLGIGRLDNGLSGKFNSLTQELDKIGKAGLENFPYENYKKHMKGLILGDKKEVIALNKIFDNFKAKNATLSSILVEAKNIVANISFHLDKAADLKRQILQREVNLQVGIEELANSIQGNYSKNLFLIKILICASLIISVLVSIVFGQFIARTVLRPIDVLIDHLEAPDRVPLDHFNFSNYKEFDFLVKSIKKYEEKIKEQQKKIEVESRFITLGQISSGLSHELKNPLAIIRGRAQSLERHGLLSHEKAAHDNINSIYEQVERINKTLLGLRNIILDQKINQHEDINFNDVLTHIVLLLGKKVEKEGIELNINVDTNNIGFYGHEILMSEAIYSLVNFSRNKIKNLERKRIDVKVRTNDKKIFVVISDSAINLKQKDIDESKQTGGISIDYCRKIIRDHGGSLWVGNEKTGRFILQLPKLVENKEFVA